MSLIINTPYVCPAQHWVDARAMGLDTSKNPYFTTVSRSGATLTVGVSLQNGGTLTSPTPGALRSFQVDEGSTGTWSSAGFTAAISGNSVVLTRSTGTWAANTKVRYLQGLEDRASGDSATEDLIINSALYETWAADVIGRGLPVLGSNTGSAWEPNWEATAA
jgi:hypothetical protein